MNLTTNNEQGHNMKRVLFITDRVMHYQKETYKALEKQLQVQDIELWLLSGRDARHAVGRVGIKEPVVLNEAKYDFREYRFGTYTFRRYFGVVKKIAEIRPDIVINAAHSGNWSHWKISDQKYRLGFKLMSWLCGYEFHPGKLKGFLLDRFIPRYDYHLAYHSNARDYAMSHGARADQVTVMHNTINEEKIATLPKAEARALVVDKHPEIGDRKIILFVGAVLAEKRIEVILQALDRMQRKDAVLVLVGDGEHLPVIRQLSAGRDDVVLTGSIVEGVGPYFDAAEMYVLPGTGGLGINEAMAHRLPIVSGFADGSADDLVVDGENGFRLRENTPEELAEKMARILDSPELVARMGERSREMITGKFAFREFINRIVTELTRLAR
ncbi:MAG: glycosyltransferase family 4 protein [Rhizobium sp.]|nr:glycosyltransferase family 4 protein [Rhizobium sp.]